MSPARQPHAILDLASRRLKGMKIERLLGLTPSPKPIRLLEIGTGSGGIAHYFATHPKLSFDVDAVDVHDNRRVSEGYRYHPVTGTALPFGEASFDVVITNHVIEHVGGRKEQLAHLQEIARVLCPTGVGYLAVPNRWMLIEPHYQLAFLSWLPPPWRSPYLRMMRKGKTYDCEPLQQNPLEHLLTDAGMKYQNLCIEALRATFEIESPNSLGSSLLKNIPDGLIKPLRRIIPTLIYRLTRSE